jgi:Domain of unknown function (DUF4359)
MAKLFSLGTLILGGLGVTMVLTNPQSSNYEAYAGDRLNGYLKDNICQQDRAGLGELFQSQCKLMLETATPQVGKLVATQTKRQNFFFFSLYQSNLSLPSPLPSYQVNTIGAFNQFFVYQSQKM